MHELDRLRDVSQEDYLVCRGQLLSELREAEDSNKMTHQMQVVYDQILKDT